MCVCLLGQSSYEDTTTADLLNIGGSPARSPPISGTNIKPTPPKAPHNDSDPFGLFADSGPVQSPPVSEARRGEDERDHTMLASLPSPPHLLRSWLILSTGRYDMQVQQSQPSRSSSTSAATPDLLNFDSFGGRAMPPQQQQPMARGVPPRGVPLQQQPPRPFQNPNSGWSAF